MRVCAAFALASVAVIFPACSEGPTKSGGSAGSSETTATSTVTESSNQSKGGTGNGSKKPTSSKAPANGAASSNPDNTDSGASGGEDGTAANYGAEGGSGVSAGGTSGRTSGSAPEGGTSGSTTSESATGDCTDIQTADHQGEPCSIWVDWGHCDAEWLQGFCNKTCGRCSGSSSSSGNGGTTGGDTSTRSGGSGASVATTASTPSGGPTVTRLGNDAPVGYATRYWDCCKPHCAWPGNANGNLRMCTEQNQSLGDSGASSSCDGGPAYTCWDMAPWAVSDTLAYGYAATPGGGSDCGKCYQLDFTGESKDNPGDDGAKAIGAKTMIVQATNKGYDVAGGQFDLLIPGGGVGAFNGCSKQWKVDNSQLGAQYGGFALSCNYDKECTRKRCESVFSGSNMEPLKKGCLFYVDWLETADNPRVRYKQVPCPSALSAKSGISG